jgi:hypothetical protein
MFLFTVSGETQTFYKDNTMNITTSQDKAFWAFLLNAALNNYETVVNFLNDRFGKKSPDIYTVLRDKNVPEANKQRLVLQLLKRLPFLNAIRENVEQATREEKNENGESHDYWDIDQRQLTPENYADILEYYGKLLENLRNFYTHIDHDAVSFGTDNNVKRYQLNLLQILTAALRETKRRFNYPAPQENNNIDELLHLRRYNGVDRVTEQEYRDFQKRREEGKLDLLEMPVFGENGKYSKMKDNLNCRLFEKNGGDYVFTERGLAFFVAWFLQPDEIDKMFQKIKPTAVEKDRRTKQFLAAKRCFGVFHINLPKTRIESAEKMTPDTLGLDIIAELHKCPGTVYNYISRDDIKRVRDYTNKNAAVIDAAQGTPQTNETDEDSEENPDTDYSGRRAKNRFSYLALSYLDMSEAFDKIRFRIDWGNYIFDSYPKNTIDGSTLPDRRLQKRIYSYERMQDAYKWFNENRHSEELNPRYKETQQETQQETTEETTLTEFRIPMVPQYSISRTTKSIGITFETVPQPEFTGKTTRRRKPDAFISLEYLPVLVFLAANKRSGQAQNIFLDYYTNWRKMLQMLKDGKPVTEDTCKQLGISFADLPLEFRSFIETGKLITPKESQQMQSKLAVILEKTERTKKNFEQECKTDFKPGDKKKRRWKSGDIGSFFARDLVKLQRPNHLKPHQGKITSANFDALQAAIAKYRSTDAGTLRDIFAKAGLLNNPDYPHPFLNELVDARGVKDLTLQRFFRSYLAAKIQYIKDCQSGKEKTYLLDKLQRKADRKRQPDYIKELAEKYLHEPLVVPKHLLDGIIADFVKEECPEKYAEKEKETTKNGKGMNTTFLIMRYHQWKYKDASQWFYTLPHSIDSDTLKKITNLLKVKISKKTNRNTNNVGLDDRDQQELYNRWAAITKQERNGKRPVLLKELNKIRKDFMKNWKRTVKVWGEDNPVDYREKFAQRANRIQRIEEKMPQLKLQDIVLFHAACSLLQIEGSAKLGDIQEGKAYLLGQQERKLSRTFSLPATAKKDEKKRIDATLIGKMKIKESGNFNRMLNDPRVPSILRLSLAAQRVGGSVAVDYESLRLELADFDRNRLAVFKWVHDFEEQVKRKYPAECKAKRKDGYVNFLAHCEVLIDKGELSKGEALVLRQIRNGFSHNFLPEFEYADQRDLSAEENAAARELFDKHQQQLRERCIGKDACSDAFGFTKKVLTLWRDLIR